MKNTTFVGMKSLINTHFPKGTIFFKTQLEIQSFFHFTNPNNVFWRSLKPTISFCDVILNVSQPCFHLCWNWSSIMSGCSLTFTLHYSAQSERLCSILLEMDFRQADQAVRKPYVQSIQTTTPTRHCSPMGRCHLMSNKSTAKCFDSFQQVQMFEPIQVKTFCSDSNILKLSNVAVFYLW